MIFVLGKCKCGCNEDIPIRSKLKRLQLFKHGHNATGENNYAWKGGRNTNGIGYITIYSPNHPYRDKRGRVYEHRLIMEQHLGRYLLPTELVHHKNEIVTDNRIENLQLMSKKEHQQHHMGGKC